jgi:fermentation-respiration switch protein FrsA (DUF1100 family)
VPPHSRRRLWPRRLVLAFAVLATVAAGCSSGPDATTSGRPTPHAVGVLTLHLVDTTRPTPANGAAPGHPGRTLVTTVLYPAQGTPGGPAVSGAVPDRAGGPYPLVAFAHGFGADVTAYLPLLERWAAAGFVVAAPLFPLTNGKAPGGPDLSDYVHQPGDMSFVITEVLGLSGRSTGALSGLVDGNEIGAAGHSLGGVTTLGLVANSCCRDPRVKAAVVMSGDAITFPTGRVEDAEAPPILLVHGDNDTVVPYVSSVDVFNAANPPKGLLTILGGGHGAPIDSSGRAFASVVNATVDFFDRYLKGRSGALFRLEHDAQPGLTKLLFVSQPGRRVVLPVPTTVATSLHATATPSQGLTGGETVTVAWSGYTPGQTVNVLECSSSLPTSANDCELHGAVLLHLDPTGEGSTPFTIVEGKVGSGTCDASHPHCVIAVDQGGSLAPSSNTLIPITFRG